MAWYLIYWLVCVCFHIALFASSLYQYVMLTDLEADYLNPFELASRINQLVVPELIVHGVFCGLFLLAQRILWCVCGKSICMTPTEKRCRLVNLVVDFCLLTIIIIRIIISTIFVTSSAYEELDIRAAFLEF